MFLKKNTTTSKIRAAFIISLMVFLIGANIYQIHLSRTQGFPSAKLIVSDFLSFLILLFFIRSLRESWKRIFLVVWDSLAIMILILAYIVFFSLLGFSMFSSFHHDDQMHYYRDIPATFFNMYVLFTTSNFPDILFPFWKASGFAAIYFIGFLMLGLYMLLNLMLAVFYNSYKNRIESKISKYDILREEFLRKEFDAIGTPIKDNITTKQFRDKFGPKVINQSEKVQSLLKEIENERELGISDGLIYFEDFSYMYMFLDFNINKRKRSGSGSTILRKGSRDLNRRGAERKRNAKRDQKKEDEDSNSSFESDSDFDELQEDDESGGPHSAGYKQLGWWGRIIKRNRRKWNKTKLGKGIINFSDQFFDSCVY